MQEPTTIDFETDAIRKRPHYPPKPVGLAVRYPGGKTEYLAFGHPEGNNSSVHEVRRVLHEANERGPLLFHNASFDADIVQTRFSLTPQQIEDTLYLGFLNDPYGELSLKPMAERHLDMPPEEQTALRDWILENVPGAKRKKTKWGEFIGQAPGNIVAPYAIGDVERTYKLWRKLKPEVYRRGMGEAYEREVALTPVTLDMERSGVRVDVKRLNAALNAFERLDEAMLARLRKKLRVGRDFNLNSPKQLSEALLRRNKLDAVIKTKNGQVSTKISVLKHTCNDRELLDLLSVHSVVEKYTSTFMRPWLAQAAISGGRILPTFNQVRGRQDGFGGARSGRYSSNDPNLQNVATNPEDSQNREVLMLMQEWLRREVSYDFGGMRDYIVADENCVMICVDYNQQELRILAHFEQDVLMRAYLANPLMDIHTFCQQLVKEAIGVEFPRKHIKVTVFGIVYGMGLDSLATRLEVDRDTAKQVRDGIYKAIPGIPALMKDLKRLAARDRPLTTWGGREYFCEEPRVSKKTGRWQTYEYKMLNYLIQPSAADCTKQGMLNVRSIVPEARIAIQVHDELVCMAPSRVYGPRIAEAMCAVKLRVPMVAEPKYSETTWARAA